VLVSSEPVRQPANDLIAFDISRQSPEQIAQMFARWKERRKRLQAVGSQRSSRPPHLKPVPPITHGAARQAEEAAPTASASAEPGGPVRYSASFESVLAAREPTLAQRVWNPDARLAKLGRPHAPRRRSRMKWALAGAASVVAAVAAGARHSVASQSVLRGRRRPLDRGESGSNIAQSSPADRKGIRPTFLNLDPGARR
jgi:hypothetical protein